MNEAHLHARAFLFLSRSERRDVGTGGTRAGAVMPALRPQAVGITPFARIRDLGRIEPAEFKCKLVNMKNAVSSCLQNYFC